MRYIGNVEIGMQIPVVARSWGMGLLSVVVSFAKRTTGEGGTHILHQTI